jgi:hypothetical protein
LDGKTDSFNFRVQTTSFCPKLAQDYNKKCFLPQTQSCDVSPTPKCNCLPGFLGDLCQYNVQTFSTTETLNTSLVSPSDILVAILTVPVSYVSTYSISIDFSGYVPTPLPHFATKPSGDGQFMFLYFQIEVPQFFDGSAVLTEKFSVTATLSITDDGNGSKFFSSQVELNSDCSNFTLSDDIIPRLAGCSANRVLCKRPNYGVNCEYQINSFEPLFGPLQYSSTVNLIGTIPPGTPLPFYIGFINNPFTITFDADQSAPFTLGGAHPGQPHESISDLARITHRAGPMELTQTFGIYLLSTCQDMIDFDGLILRPKCYAPNTQRCYIQGLLDPTFTQPYCGCQLDYFGPQCQFKWAGQIIDNIFRFDLDVTPQYSLPDFIVLSYSNGTENIEEMTPFIVDHLHRRLGDPSNPISSVSVRFNDPATVDGVYDFRHPADQTARSLPWLTTVRYTDDLSTYKTRCIDGTIYESDDGIEKCECTNSKFGDRCQFELKYIFSRQLDSANPRPGDTITVYSHPELPLGYPYQVNISVQFELENVFHQLSPQSPTFSFTIPPTTQPSPSYTILVGHSDDLPSQSVFMVDNPSAICQQQISTCPNQKCNPTGGCSGECMPGYLTDPNDSTQCGLLLTPYLVGLSPWIDLSNDSRYFSPGQTIEFGLSQATTIQLEGVVSYYDGTDQIATSPIVFSSQSQNYASTLPAMVYSLSKPQIQIKLSERSSPGVIIGTIRGTLVEPCQLAPKLNPLSRTIQSKACNLDHTESCQFLPGFSSGVVQTKCNCKDNYYGDQCDLYLLTTPTQDQINDVSFVHREDMQIRIDYAYRPTWNGSKWNKANPINIELNIVDSGSSRVFTDFIAPASGDELQTAYFSLPPAATATSSDLKFFDSATILTFPPTTVIYSTTCAQCNGVGVSDSSKCLRNRNDDQLVQCTCGSGYTGTVCDTTYTVTSRPTQLVRESLTDVASGIKPMTSYYWGQEVTITSPTSPWKDQQVNVYLTNTLIKEFQTTETSGDLTFNLPIVPILADWDLLPHALSLTYLGNTLDATLPINSSCQWFNNYVDTTLENACVLENTATCNILAVDPVACVCKDLQVVGSISTSYTGPQCQYKITTQSGPYYIGQHLEITVTREKNAGNYVMDPFEFAIQSTTPSSDPIILEVLHTRPIDSIANTVTGVVYTVKIPTVPGNVDPPTLLNPSGYQEFLLQIALETSSISISAPSKIVSGCYWAELVEHNLVCNTAIDSQTGIPAAKSCVNQSTGQIECQCNQGWNNKECRFRLILRTASNHQDGSYSPDQPLLLELLDYPNQFISRGLSLDDLGFTTNIGNYFSFSAVYVKSITNELSTFIYASSIPASEFKDTLTLQRKSVPHSIDISYVSQLPPQTNKLQMFITTLTCPFGYNYITNSCTCPQSWTIGGKCDIALTFTIPPNWREDIRSGLPSAFIQRSNFKFQFGFEHIDSIFGGPVEPQTPFPTVTANNSNMPNFHIESIPITRPEPASTLDLQVIKPPVNGGSGLYQLTLDMPIFSYSQSQLVIITHDSPPQTHSLGSFYVVKAGACFDEGSAFEATPFCVCKLDWYGPTCQYQFKPLFWVIDLQLPSTAFTIPYSELTPNLADSNGGADFDFVSLELVPEKDTDGLNLPIDPLLPRTILLQHDVQNKQFIFDGNQPLPSQQFTAPYPRYKITFGLYNSDKSSFILKVANEYDFFTIRTQQNIHPFPTLTRLTQLPSDSYSFAESFPQHYLETAKYLLHSNEQNSFIISLPAPESPHSYFTINTPTPSTPPSEIKISYYPPIGDGVYSSTPRVIHRESIRGTPFSQSLLVSVPSTLIANKAFYTITYYTATTHHSTTMSPSTQQYDSHTAVSPLFSLVSACFDIDTSTSTPTLINTCQSGGRCMPNGKCICPANASGALCNVTTKPCEQCDSTHISGCTASNQCICNADWEGSLCNISTSCHNDAICTTGMGLLIPIAGQKCGDKCQCNNANIIGQRCETCILQCNNGKSMQKCSKCGCDAGFTGSTCLCKSDTGTVTINGIPADLLALSTWVKAYPALDTDLLRPDFVNLLRASVEITRLELETLLTDFLQLQPGSLILTMTAIEAPTSTSTVPVYYTQLKAQIVFGCPEWNPLLDRNELKKRWDTIIPLLFDFVSKNFIVPDNSGPDIIDVGGLDPTPGTYEPDDGESNSGFTMFNWDSYLFIFFTIVALIHG